MMNEGCIITYNVLETLTNQNNYESFLKQIEESFPDDLILIEKDETKVTFNYEHIKIWEIPLKCNLLLDGNIFILKQDLNISDENFEKVCDRLLSYLIVLKENFCAKILIRRVNLKDSIEVFPMSRYTSDLQRGYTVKLYEVKQKRRPIDEEELVNIFVMLDEFRQNQNVYGTKLAISILEDTYIVPSTLRKVYIEELCKIFKEFSTIYWLDYTTKQSSSEAYKFLLNAAINSNIDTANLDPMQIYSSDTKKLETIISCDSEFQSNKFTEKQEFNHFKDLKSVTLWYHLGETFNQKKSVALMEELLKREPDEKIDKTADQHQSNLVKNYCNGLITLEEKTDQNESPIEEDKNAGLHFKLIFHNYLFKLLNHVWVRTNKFEILKKKSTYLLVLQISEEICIIYLDMIFNGNEGSLEFFDKTIFQDIAGWAELCIRALIDTVTMKNTFEVSIVDHKNRLDRYLVGNNFGSGTGEIKSWEDLVHQEFKLYYQYLVIKEFQNNSKEMVINEVTSY